MKQTDRTRLAGVLRFIPAVIWMAVIFMLSSRTGDEVGSLLPFFQQFFPSMESFDWGHYVSYFVLAAAIDFGIGKRADRLVWKVAIVLLCGLYGVTDEYHQSFVGGRTPDIMDIRNDMIGAAVWVLLISIPPLRKLWRKF
ncbi:VanZ family protein [Paenibacillus gorillae]|uniref:VanZ family protein n=1 Tax=Paenibacillus gorillae TaxID=1243662 RepID=UPI0004B8B927|nr:VanZ family protein [Paenibacillus gorillae]